MHPTAPFVTGLSFPEGPVVLPDGTLVFTEIAGGRLSAWTSADGVQLLATTAGGPNGATLARDGTIFVTQNGGAAGGGAPAIAGIQRIDPDGSVSTVITEINGVQLDAPNDLAFGPDGRLYFTDPRHGPDAPIRKNGRLYAYDTQSGQGELLIELGPDYPNGIGFLSDGTLVWTESFSRRVMRWTAEGPALIVELPERHFPDGFCVGADDRLYVASTYGHCINVIDVVDVIEKNNGGAIVEQLPCADGMPTNCCFLGTDLIVTESRHGTLWRYQIGTEGLALNQGA
ncbi:MAG: SMP-30/gluconolactonase/LRE family protein [Ilumatobacteraceae bacterium]